MFDFGFIGFSSIDLRNPKLLIFATPYLSGSFTLTPNKVEKFFLFIIFFKIA